MKLIKSISLMVILSLVQMPNLMAIRNNKAEGHTMGHYIGHAIGQGTIFLGSGLPLAAGLFTAAGLCGYGAARHNPISLLAGVAVGAAGIGTSAYMFYKAPQWTDTYLLGYTSERTTQQNIVSLASNIIIQPFPLGVWAGEFVTHLDNIVPEDN